MLLFVLAQASVTQDTHGVRSVFLGGGEPPACVCTDFCKKTNKTKNLPSMTQLRVGRDSGDGWRSHEALCFCAADQGLRVSPDGVKGGMKG